MSKVNDILTKLGLKPHPSNWLHFAVGSLCGVFAFLFSFYEQELSIFVSVAIGTGFAFFAGLIKEWWDMPSFDWLDLIMTTFGGLAGALMAITITLIL